MRLQEIAKNDQKLQEWDPTILGWTLDAIRDLTRGATSKSRMADVKKQNAEIKARRDNKTKRRSGGSDDYDHIINKYKDR